MKVLWAGVRYELAVARSSPAELSWLFVAPFYSLIFLAIVRHSGRDDLVSYAVLGPTVMSLVGTAIVSAGNLIDRDRQNALLELEVVAPASFALTLVGRIVGILAVGLIAVPEAWLVAGLVFGEWVSIPHPWLFAVALILIVLATAAAALAMAAIFVLARSARIFQNSLSFPLFLLGGAVVPVSVLPGWLHPIARIVYLSWGTDALRAATAAGSVSSQWWRLGVVAGLGAVNLLAGIVFVHRTVRRVRLTGSVSYA